MHKRAHSSTLERLITLLGAGYTIRVQDSCSSRNVVSLEHPSNRQRVKEKSLWLQENGDLFGFSYSEEEPELFIDAADQEAFQKLITSTPKPTWWEVHSGPFYTVLSVVLAAVFMYICIVFAQFTFDFLKTI